MTNLTINRLNLLMATKRLMQVSPTSYNSELMLKAIDGKLALVAFGEGIIGIECLPDKADIDEDVVVNLEKFHVFLQVRYEDTISIKVNPKSVKLSAGSSSSTIGRSVLRLQAGIPDKSLFVGEIPSKAFDDLVRVANISDDKDMARPILGGVYLTITPGDIRAISANGIAFGYAWEQGNGISTERKERFLIKATAASAARISAAVWFNSVCLPWKSSRDMARVSNSACACCQKSVLPMLVELTEPVGSCIAE